MRHLIISFFKKLSTFFLLASLATMAWFFGTVYAASTTRAAVLTDVSELFIVGAAAGLLALGVLLKEYLSTVNDDSDDVA